MGDVLIGIAYRPEVIVVVLAQKQHTAASRIGKFAKRNLPAETSLALPSTVGRCLQTVTRVKNLPNPLTFNRIGLYWSGDLFNCLFLNLISKDRLVSSEATNEKVFPTRTRYLPSFVTTWLILVVLNSISPYAKVIKSDFSDLLFDFLSLWFKSFCSLMVWSCTLIWVRYFSLPLAKTSFSSFNLWFTVANFWAIRWTNS